MQTPPKNFSRNYPLGGEQIGPAWRALWGALDARRWQRGPDLCSRLAAELELSPKTLAGLLWRAQKAGQVQQRVVKDPTRKRFVTEYRGIE